MHYSPRTSHVFPGCTPHLQAAELVAALRQTAHMVAVMEQDVLMQAFGDSQVGVGLLLTGSSVVTCLGHATAAEQSPPRSIWTKSPVVAVSDVRRHHLALCAAQRDARLLIAVGPAGPLQMTVAEATEIADNALEHSVRSILQAVQVRVVSGCSFLCPPAARSCFQSGGHGCCSSPLPAAALTPQLAHICANAEEQPRRSNGLVPYVNGSDPYVCTAPTRRPAGARGAEEQPWRAHVARPRPAPL